MYAKLVPAFNTSQDSTESYLLSIAVLLGSVVGSFSTIFTVNYWGQKKITFFASIAASVFNLLAMIPVSWQYLFAMRLLVGVFGSMLTTIVPVWMSELATSSHRAIITVLF